MELPDSLETLYSIKGIYLFDNELNPFVGVLQINEDNNITGFISDTFNTKRYDVEGKLKKSKNVVIIDFIKKPNDGIHANIFYNFEKNGRYIEGKYNGSWSFKEQDVCKLGIGYKPGIGEAVYQKKVENNNIATLTLDSKF